MKSLSIIFCLMLCSCAFDGPSRPDIPVSGNIVLVSGPGDAGKYHLAEQQKLESGDMFTPLTDNDSLRKIVIKDSLVFVETIDFEKQPKYYRFANANGSQTGKKGISQMEFDEAIADGVGCKVIVVPKDEKP